MTHPLKILVVDDHPIVRKGLIQAIAEEDHLVVVGEASSAREALAFVTTNPVDVVVSDFRMPGMNGLELAVRLLDRDPPIPVVLLTMHDDEEVFNEAANCGVLVYLLKDEIIDNIQKGIVAAAMGESFVSPSLGKLVMRRSQGTQRFKKKQSGLGKLTRSERAVLKQVAQSKSSKEVATALSISPHTVSTHRSNIAKKLGLSGKQPLLNFALANRSAILNLDD